MTRQQTREALSHALQRWEDEDADADPTPTLRHVEVFALASLAHELHEIALTLQARHEEAIDRGSPAFPPSGHSLSVEYNGDECGALPAATAKPELRCRLALGHAGPHRWGEDG